MAEVTAWFKSNVEAPMSRNGIKVTLRLVKVSTFKTVVVKLPMM